ncbi:MAG: GFA family protein [Betaproteobacteria bacterium]
MQIDGACHCGEVSFTAEVDPTRVVVCHCTDCQVLSGGPFRAIVTAPYGTLIVKGQTRSYIKMAQSGNRRAQVFCPECAAPLWSTDPDHPTSVNIRLGCVAQRAWFKPTLQIWQHSALPWVSQLSSVPGSAEQQALVPDPPPASVA